MKRWPSKAPAGATEDPKDSAAQPSAQTAGWQVELRTLSPFDQIQSLRERLLANPSDLQSRERLHRLLSAARATRAELLAHARDYLGALVAQSRGDQAYALYESCLEIDTEFQPHADQVLGLARLALMRKDSQKAMRIMERFDCDADHPHAPEVSFLTARVLRDDKQFAKALNLINVLLEKYPNSVVTRDAKALQRALRLAVEAVPPGH